MNTLDQWGAEAKQDLENSLKIGTKTGINLERILTLIDLVRKKDEALKFYAQSDWLYHSLSLDTVMAKDLGSKADKALALTEQLK